MIAGLGSLIWAGTIAAGGLEPITLDVLFGDMRMKTLNTERWREMLGLLLTASWMGVLVAMSSGRRRA